MRNGLKLLAPFIALLAIGACRAKGPGPIASHQRLDANASALRDAFNADYGKVRVVMLVSPT
jgi:hypothetical protein